MYAVAQLLREQAEEADECPGVTCNTADCTADAEQRRIDLKSHHHCRWCSTHAEPAAIAAARAYRDSH